MTCVLLFLVFVLELPWDVFTYRLGVLVFSLPPSHIPLYYSNLFSAFGFVPSPRLRTFHRHIFTMPGLDTYYTLDVDDSSIRALFLLLLLLPRTTPHHTTAYTAYLGMFLA